MKIHYHFLILLLLATNYFASSPALSQPPSTPNAPTANTMADDVRVMGQPFAEERMAAQNFIESINEARKELSMKQLGLAKSKIILARNLIPIITRVTPSQSRLTRVEFGGGLYADDLEQRKNYAPIETQSLENFTRNAGPRWIKSTRLESDAQIVYITLNLANETAQTYLDQAEKDVTAGKIKEAETQLSELSDRVIKVGENVPAAVQARDYITLADNYIASGNFFGARSSLVRANEYLDKMKNEESYKTYYSDIVTLHHDIANLQDAFAKMDAEQIKDAGINLKKWKQQVAVWARE